MALALASCGAPGDPAPDVTARPTAEGLKVDVPGNKTFTQCKWELNGTHTLLANNDLEPGTVVIPFFGFADNAGLRFAWPGMPLEKLVIDCDGAGASTYIYITW